MLNQTPQSWTAWIKTPVRGLLPAVALAGALVAPAVSYAEAYDLDIHHTSTVGERYSIEGEAYFNQFSTQIIADDAPIEEESSREINLLGEIEFLAIDDAGDVTQLALTVVRYDMEIDSEGVGLEEGKRIIATLNGTEVDYRYEGAGEVAEDVAMLLDEMIGKMLYDGESDAGEDSAMFGTDVPRTPGEQWSFDGPAFLTAMAEESGAAGLSQTATFSDNEINFVQVNTDVFGENVAVVNYVLNAEGFAFGGADYPDFLKTDESALEFTGEMWMPLDPESGQSHLEYRMEMVFNVSGVEPTQNIKLVVQSRVDAGSSITLHRIAQ